MLDYEIVSLRERPAMKGRMAKWFHEKWRVPLAAYEESMEMCIAASGSVPQWYTAMADDEIIGGIGVIDNDFHQRRDLTPNVCAVYVEEKYRSNAVAGALLERVCNDMKKAGIDTLYLITDHTTFYERYGWRFLCMVKEDSGNMTRMYIHSY